MFQQLFESRTFTDHMGEPSFGRKAMFCILVFLGILACLSLCLVAWLDDTKHAQAVATHAKGILEWGTGLVALLYTGAQASKGMAQMGSQTPMPPPLTVPGAPSTTPAPAPPGPLLAPVPGTPTAPQSGGA